MADSSVAVTAGTGTSIDTRTESTNGNHRQVVVLGDPSTNTAVASVTDIGSGAFAALVVRPHATPAADWKYAAAGSGIVNTTTAVTIKTAAGASIKNYITGLQVQTATLGGATELVIRDGAGGTVIWRTQLQTTALPLVNVSFPNPLVGTANTLLEVATLTAVTGGVYVNVQGYAAA